MLISGSPVGQSVGPSIHRLVVWKAWFFPLLLRVGDGCPRVEAHFESFIACMSFWLFVCPMMEDRVGELNDSLLKFFLVDGWSDIQKVELHKENFSKLCKDIQNR